MKKYVTNASFPINIDVARCTSFYNLLYPHKISLKNNKK